MSGRWNLGLVLALAWSAGCAAGGENDAGVVPQEDAGGEKDTGELDKDTGEPEDVVLPSFDIPVDRGGAPDVVAAPDAVAPPDVPGDAGADVRDAFAGPHDLGCTAVCNGTCTNTDSDPRNCGACGQDCALRPGADPARVTCVRGACVFGTTGCVAGRGDCDGNAANGCEALLNSATRCGSCVEGCREPTPLCAMVSGAPSGYACTSGCVSPRPSRCGTSCVDTASDPLNCGTCGNVCPTGGTGATASCVGGLCRLTCVSGYGDCDGNPANGCEVRVTTSALHCGACGNVCGGGANATAVCSSGACALTCTAGHGNCDGMAANGCETDTRATATACGACGVTCPARANATPACASGACSFTCAADFANCDALATNGCEADLRVSATSCGMCGRRCAAQSNATPTCAAGVCGIACLAGFGDCDALGSNGCEAPFATDPNNCGACGTRCMGGANATATCAGSRCGLSCSSGFGDCDAAAGNGCETATSTSMAHCGACGRACNAPPNSTAACTAGSCVVTCDAGYTLSAGTCVRTPPRPVSPAGFSFATSTTPTFRVALPPGQTGAFVEVCRDRGCTSVSTTVTFTGSSGAITAQLPTGMYFWRASGRVGSSTATTAGTPAVFYVAAARRPSISAAWGSVLDANADGSPEMLVGAPGANQARAYAGTTSGYSTTSYATLSGGTTYGTAAAAIGDVNGDGYADAAVGEPGTNRVYVYRGASGGLSTAPTVLVAPPSTVQFGAAVAGAGDVNGDGFSDLLVGAPTSNRAFLYLGSAAGIAASAAGVPVDPTGSPSNYGASVAGIGDVNADGFSDVAVGTNGSNNVYVFLGSATGLGSPTVVGAGASGFGFAVAAAGDVTNDGYPDMIVGAYSAQVAYVFAGGASGIATSSTVTLAVASDGVLFGWSVDGLGDVTGDGFGDVLVGAPGSERAYLFPGGPAGLVSSPSQTYLPTAGAIGTLLGRAVARLGDVNRDGVFDFALGQPGRYTVQTYRGAATPVLWQTFSNTSTSQFGASFAR